MMKLVVVCLFLVVSLHLGSSRDQEFQVSQLPASTCSALPACLSLNSSSSPPYLCEPATFSSCAEACPGLSCDIVSNVKNSHHSWLQVITNPLDHI